MTPELVCERWSIGFTSLFSARVRWGCKVAFSTLRPRPNGRHFADDTFKRIFLNENVWISLKISLKFVPRVRINNIPALVQIMAWRRPGGKPLSKPMMVSLLTHICVTRPQWVNWNRHQEIPLEQLVAPRWGSFCARYVYIYVVMMAFLPCVHGTLRAAILIDTCRALLYSQTAGVWHQWSRLLR